jgi:hypothetical protein
VATRLGEAAHKAQLHRVVCYPKYNRHRGGRGLGCQRSWNAAHCDDNRYMMGNQIGGQFWKSIILAVSRTIFNRDVLPLDKADFLYAPSNCSDQNESRPMAAAPDLTQMQSKDIIDALLKVEGRLSAVACPFHWC